jgi:RecJ-like exonuclease
MAKGKPVVVTFRVDAHLARALERLPDKSAFIRTAIEKALHEPCPACAGKGVVDCDAAAWLTEVLAQNEARNCTCCDVAFAAADPAQPEPVCGHCGPEDHHH